MIDRHFSICGILLIGLMGCSDSPNHGNRSTAAAALPTIAAESPPPPDAPKPTLVAKKNSDRRTVADYFLAMPAKYLQLMIAGRQRQQMLNGAKRGEANSIYDLKNGYLSMNPGGDTCGSYTMAIFNRPTGTPLVASNISCTVGDVLVILDPAQNWQDVTKTVLPADLTPDPDLKYTIGVVLPRMGRVIEILRVNEDGSKKSIDRYRFEGQRFVQR